MILLFTREATTLPFMANSLIMLMVLSFDCFETPAACYLFEEIARGTRSIFGGLGDECLLDLFLQAVHEFLLRAGDG